MRLYSARRIFCIAILVLFTLVSPLRFVSLPRAFHRQGRHVSSSLRASRYLVSSFTTGISINPVATAHLTNTLATTLRSTSSSTLNVLYIPTALYAPRPGSNATLGKQRQRRKAEARKSLRAIVEYLDDLRLGVEVRARTVDVANVDGEAAAFAATVDDRGPGEYFFEATM